MSSYLNEFLNLNCSSDILDVVRPIASGSEKEISETMSIISILRDIVIKEKYKYTILELCAGNSLPSITSSFLLPIKKSIAIDKKVPKRDYSKVLNYEYIEENIYNDNEFINLIKNEKDLILISCHPCNKLSIKTINIYNNNENIKYLILMPCCEGKIKEWSSGQLNYLKNKIGSYSTWVFYLSTLIKYNTSIKIDSNCLSPKNHIIFSYKE